ncbi:MAG: alanine racemase, partial [Parcubacteria group bacterium Gr01-1014_70]
QSLALNKIKLKPVLVWKARIAQVKQIPKGATVGYSRSFTALQLMTIAVIPVGYWDGYDRRLSNKGSVLIKGKKVPVVGNICMNMIMVDVTGVGHLNAGDEAILLGKQGAAEITAEEIAAKVGTINYEIITRINPVIPRIVL